MTDRTEHDTPHDLLGTPLPDGKPSLSNDALMLDEPLGNRRELPLTGLELEPQVINLTGGRSFLTVLKRFGPANQAPLSFPLARWTLTVDVPVDDPDLRRLLDARTNKSSRSAVGSI